MQDEDAVGTGEIDESRQQRAKNDGTCGYIGGIAQPLLPNIHLDFGRVQQLSHTEQTRRLFGDQLESPADIAR